MKIEKVNQVRKAIAKYKNSYILYERNTPNTATLFLNYYYGDS